MTVSSYICHSLFFVIFNQMTVTWIVSFMCLIMLSMISASRGETDVLVSELEQLLRRVSGGVSDY